MPTRPQKKAFTLLASDVLAHREALGFRAYGISVSNLSAQWLALPQIDQFVAPTSRGTFALDPGTELGEFVWGSPPGVIQPFAVTGQIALVVFTEEPLPDAGGPIIGTAVASVAVAESYTAATLPAPGHRGRIVILTDYDRALWKDTGTQWVSVEGETFNVKQFDVVGNDIADDGAQIAAAWAALIASGKPGTLLFPPGTYKSATGFPNFAVAGTRILGLGTAILHSTAAGNVVNVDAGAGGVMDVEMHNLTLQGSAVATNGLFLKACHHSRFRDIKVKNVTASGLLTNFCVLNTYDTFRVSANEGVMNPIPVNGMFFDKRGAAEPSTASLVLNPIIEGVSGSGIKLGVTSSIGIYGGSSEGNGRGVELTTDAVRNRIELIDLEANSVEDILCSGADNTFVDVMCVSLGAQGFLNFVGASHNTVQRGTFNGIGVDGASPGTSIIDVKYNFYNTGGLTGAGAAGAMKVHNYDLGAGAYDYVVHAQQLRGVNGSIGDPAYAFNAESSGFYRNAAGDIRIAVQGADLVKFLGTGATNFLYNLYPPASLTVAQSACAIFAGNGVPNNANGNNGDVYFNSAGGALTTMYQKRAGAWVGIV